MATVRLHQSEINRLLRGPGSPIVRHVREIVRNASRFAKVTGPRETGQLVSRITFDVDIRATSIVGRAGILSRIPARTRSWSTYRRPTLASVLVYQDRGVGPIRPRRSSRLRFRPKGSRTIVYAKRTSGVPSTGFLVEALRAASPYPVRTTISAR